jgi:hypothetical protein
MKGINENIRCRLFGALFSANANNGANSGFGYLNANNRSSNANANIGFRLYRKSSDFIRFLGSLHLATWQNNYFLKRCK